jgi:hypothetical protein
MANVPYIEMQPAVDYAEHDSSARMRKGSITGRVIYIRGHHKPNMFRNDLENILASTTMNLAGWTIEPPARFSTRLDQMAFSISYWESLAKT